MDTTTDIIPTENLQKMEVFIASLTVQQRAGYEDLTAEEKREILSLVPKDPDWAMMSLTAQINVKNNPSQMEEAKSSAKKTSRMIMDNIKPVQQALPSVIAPYPHDITRQSMFFIESPQKDKKNIKTSPRDNSIETVREMLNGLIIGTGSWGKLKLTGPMLFVRDEKIMLIIFSEVYDNITKGLSDPYTVNGTIRHLLKKAGYPTTGQYYKQVRDSLEHMGQVTFTLTGNLAGTKKKKRNIDPLRQYHLVKTDINTTGEDETATYSIRVDAHFFETFINEFNLYKKIDVPLYCSLPPVAAAIYRFFNSHEFTAGRKVFSMLLVAKVINLIVDKDWPDGADQNNWPDAGLKRTKKQLLQKSLELLVEKRVFPAAYIKATGRGHDDTVIVLEKALTKISLKR